MLFFDEVILKILNKIPFKNCLLTFRILQKRVLEKSVLQNIIAKNFISEYQTYVRKCLFLQLNVN